jgi:tetratricopeptide (TPR) repeat protein
LESELLGNNKLPLVKRMLNLAQVYNAQDKFSNALDETRQAKDIVIKAGASESDEMAKCMLNEGEIRQRQALYPTAQSSYAEALRIQQKLYGDKSLQRRVVYEKLASVAKDMGNLPESQEWLNKAAACK